MEVDERVHMNDYFHDERFVAKKPILDGTAQQRCGDNFYSLDATVRWIQHPNGNHTGPACLAHHARPGAPGAMRLTLAAVHAVANRAAPAHAKSR
jgi:hypothetical protein